LTDEENDTGEEPSSKLEKNLEKIGTLMETEGSYISILQDIDNGILNISVTPKSVNDGTFDKVMNRVLEYVELYADKISSQHHPKPIIDPDPPDGYG
jgi:hypothetical protein